VLQVTQRITEMAEEGKCGAPFGTPYSTSETGPRDFRDEVSCFPVGHHKVVLCCGLDLAYDVDASNSVASLRTSWFLSLWYAAHSVPDPTAPGTRVEWPLLVHELVPVSLVLSAFGQGLDILSTAPGTRVGWPLLVHELVPVSLVRSELGQGLDILSTAPGTRVEWPLLVHDWFLSLWCALHSVTGSTSSPQLLGLARSGLSAVMNG
jgi:hypothetical protein